MSIHEYPDLFIILYIFNPLPWLCKKSNNFQHRFSLCTTYFWDETSLVTLHVCMDLTSSDRTMNFSAQLFYSYSK